ncbi:MAG TPA: hypothetical protein VK652_01105 [Steroidobacteraceae bacterium]|nr:hypothetical protein [Steroidobacteraceae bacterium]
MKPSPEDFEQWRASPVTEWFMDTFLKAEMARTKQTYEHRAWEGVAADEDWTSCRERYETLDWVRGIDITDIEKTMEMQE